MCVYTYMHAHTHTHTHTHMHVCMYACMHTYIHTYIHTYQDFAPGNYPYDSRFTGQIYNSGGAGYVLNVRALAMLVNHLDAPECLPYELSA